MPAFLPVVAVAFRRVAVAFQRVAAAVRLAVAVVRQAGWPLELHIAGSQPDA